ncbi:MAG: hypothetical protein ABIH66_13780 [bacterium]
MDEAVVRRNVQNVSVIERYCRSAESRKSFLHRNQYWARMTSGRANIRNGNAFDKGFFYVNWR